MTSEQQQQMFEYAILGATMEQAQFVRHLFLMHGYNYPWKCEVEHVSFSDTLEVRVTKIVADSDLRKPIVQMFITSDPTMLRQLGLFGAEEKPATWHGARWAFISGETRVSRREASLPIRMDYVCPLTTEGTEWLANDFILGGFSNSGCVIAVRRNIDATQIAVGIDLIGWFKWAMLRMGKPAVDLQLETWADVYSIEHTQCIADDCYLDGLIQLLLRHLVAACQDAFPVTIGHYPPKKTAPILITGDSDSATSNQLDTYLEAVHSAGAKASILIRTYSPYSKAQLRMAEADGHCFGLHPYSDSGDYTQFKDSFDTLKVMHKEILGTWPSCVRNHIFQYVGSQQLTVLEREARITFDLNCVAASGETWAGTGSGVGIPISFPPLDTDTAYELFPLQFPTLIEDDVFLFDYDYCYRSFVHGAESPTDVCLDYLDDWILERSLPAVVNLHPEHVTDSTRFLLDAILEWVHIHDVWAPSLVGYAAWLAARSQVVVSVELQPIQGRVVASIVGDTACRVHINRPEGRLGSTQTIDVEPGHTSISVPISIPQQV